MVARSTGLDLIRRIPGDRSRLYPRLLPEPGGFDTIGVSNYGCLILSQSLSLFLSFSASSTTTFTFELQKFVRQIVRCAPGPNDNYATARCYSIAAHGKARKHISAAAFHGFTAPCSSIERKNVDPECFLRCTWVSIAFDQQLGKNRENKEGNELGLSISFALSFFFKFNTRALTWDGKCY